MRAADKVFLLVLAALGLGAWAGRAFDLGSAEAAAAEIRNRGWLGEFGRSPLRQIEMTPKHGRAFEGVASKS